MTYHDGDEKRRGNKPIEVLRDGPLKVSIFRNQGEQGPSYSMVPGRIYTDKETGQVHETTSFNGNEALRLAHLMTKGHDRVRHRREQDKEKQTPERGADRRSTRESDFDRER